MLGHAGDSKGAVLLRCLRERLQAPGRTTGCGDLRHGKTPLARDAWKCNRPGSSRYAYTQCFLNPLVKKQALRYHSEGSAVEAWIQIQYTISTRGQPYIRPPALICVPLCLRLLLLLDVLSCCHPIHSTSSMGISGVEITTAKTRVINRRQAETPILPSSHNSSM